MTNFARKELSKTERETFRRVMLSFEQIKADLLREINELMFEIETAKKRGEKVNFAFLQKRARLRSLLDGVDQAIENETANLSGAVTAGQQSAIDTARAAAAKFPQLAGNLVAFDGGAVRALAGIAGNKKTVDFLFRRIAKGQRAALFDALQNGIAQGLPNSEIVRQLRLKLNITQIRALTIARTETNRVYREATRQFYDDTPKIIGWRWLAVLDLRTCGICWSQHGRIFKKKTKFGTHPNCRCTMQPVFDKKEPFPTGAELFAQLTDAQKKTILGAARHELYKSGFGLSDFVIAKKTPFGLSRQFKPVSSFATREPPKRAAQ